MSKNLAKSFVWLVIAEVLFNLSGYVVHSVAGRLLTPSDYGRYGLIVSFTIMVITLIGSGIPISMGKYLSEIHITRPEMVPVIKRTGLILQLIVIGAISLIFYLVTPLISQMLGDPTLTPLFRLSTLILPAWALDSYFFYYLSGIHQFNLQSGLKILRSLFRVVLIVSLVRMFGLNGSISVYIFAPTLVFLTAWAADIFWISKKFPKIQKKLHFDWRKMLKYAWPVTLFMIFYQVLISLDMYFVKAITHSDYLAGIYNSAFLIGQIPYFLFYALTIILLPSVSESTAQNNQEKTRNIITQSLRIMIMFLVPIVILLNTYSASVIKFIYGAKYLEATLPLQILTFGIGCLTVFYILSFALNGAGKNRVPMWIACGGMFLNAILNYILIKKYGIVGSAIATSITSLVVMLIAVAYSHRYFEGILNAISLLKMALAGSFIYILSLYLTSQNLIFFAWSTLLILVYFCVLYLLKEIKESDLDIIRSIVRMKEKKDLV
ncbi:MAG: flippase [Parcubacteria group bacterium]|jgi:O-antigen/teichoic acid export membrane protein